MKTENPNITKQSKHYVTETYTMQQHVYESVVDKWFVLPESKKHAITADRQCVIIALEFVSGLHRISGCTELRYHRRALFRPIFVHDN
jgi:hypothetical protein